MEPTLQQGDKVLVRTTGLEVRRGTVVVLKRGTGGTDPGIFVMSRVVGLPGEAIESTTDGHVLIDGRILGEPYLAAGTITSGLSRQTVPAGDYFVIGDNRSNSRDSRFFGPMPGEAAIGIATAIVSPPDRARSL